MDLSTVDILLGLAAIAALTVAGIVVHHRRRSTPAATDEPVSPSDSGRHHVPKGLLESPTARLRPEILARARKHRP